MRPPSASIVCSLIVAATPLAAQNGSTIRGRILSSAGQPLPGAMVIRTQPAGDTVRADSAGHYAVQHIGPGHYVFRFAASGYQPMEAELTLGGDTVLDVDVPLAVAAAADAPGGKLDAVGFTQRRRENAGRRHVVFMGPDDLQSRHAAKVSELFQNVPEILVQPQGRVSTLQGDGGRCAMDVWIDGVHENSLSTTRGIDDILTVAQLAAVEIYPRDTQVPDQYSQVAAQISNANTGTSIRGNRGTFGTQTTHCGAILFWNR